MSLRRNASSAGAEVLAGAINGRGDIDSEINGRGDIDDSEEEEEEEENAPVFRNTPPLTISDDDRNQSLNMMRDVVISRGLANRVMDVPKVILPKGDGRPGPSERTLKGYKSRWRQAFNFCVAAGFYEEGIIFARSICPNRPPTVSVEVAKLIIMFHTGSPGSILIHPTTAMPVMSHLAESAGQPIQCCGTWRSKNTIDGFKSALSFIHEQYDRTKGDYDEACEDCLTNQIHGCEEHRRGPRLRRRGNPAYDRTFIRFCLKAMTDATKTHGKPRSNTYLVPHEVRMIRTELLSRNTLFDLMIWTIVILSIKAFLRANEGLELDMSDFLHDYLHVLEDRISQLCIEVMGKTDTCKVKLLIKDDTECAEFSSMRHSHLASTFWN
jgi:hypothetical protein